VKRLASNSPGAQVRRPAALALLVAWVGRTISAAFPQDADAFNPVAPIIKGGGDAIGWFGSKVLGAAGHVVLDGVQAILDWIYSTLAAIRRHGDRITARCANCRQAC